MLRNKNKYRGLYGVVLGAIIWSVVLPGCTKSSASDAGRDQDVQRPPAAHESKPRCTPLRIAVIQDKSLSLGPTRTPQLKAVDLEPLLDLMGHCGGELAVGVIHDRSNLGFVRLRIDAAPEEAGPPPRASNPLERRNQTAALRKQHEAFEARQQEWLDQMQTRIEAFQEALEPVLAMPANAQYSPVWDAVRRAELFLSEAQADGGTDSHRYALLITDGIDDVRPGLKSKPVVIQSGARILMVNGAGELGSLAALKPRSFESVEAAIRFVEAAIRFIVGSETR